MLFGTSLRRVFSPSGNWKLAVELDILNIKTTRGMETLSCKTPMMGEKGMWVYLLAYNLIRLIVRVRDLYTN